ncbi:MAG TPA: PAS domain S-box protein [Rectinemataceae bacterium]|nr:PAS domain S-box protein [Rectinemataceae bacterium]
MEVSGKTILLVEDERLIALFQSRKLEQGGYRVILATTGESAVNIVNKDPSAVDLILMDINLGPGIDGTQAAQEILAQHNIPIVFLSSHTEPEIVKKTEEITNYGYVVKSSSFTVLDASIKMAFKLFRAMKQLDLSSMEIESTNEELRGRLGELQAAYDDLAQRKVLQGKFFRLSPDAICITRLSDGVCTEVNQSFSHLFGYSREEALGHSCLAGDLGIWINQEERAELLRRFRDHREAATFEMDFRRKDGSVIRTSISADLISIDGEDCIISSIRDISAIKRRESELREVEERYRVLFEEAGAGILIYDRELRILDANKHSLQLFGYSKEELLALTLSELDPDLADPSVLKARGDSILGSGPYTFTAKRRLKDGRVLPTEVNAISIIWQGKPAILAVVHDIVEKIENERKYARSQAILKSTLENQNEILMVGVDQQFRCLYVNQSYHDLKLRSCGLDIKVGDCLLDNLPADRFLETSLSHYRSALAGTSVRIVEDYEEVGMTFDSVFNPIWDEDGAVLGASAFSIDISERIVLEKRLQDNEERFRLAMEASKDAIWDIDIGKSQVYFSPAYFALFGYEQAEASFAATWPAYFHSEEFVELSPLINECIENRRQEFDVDYRVTLKDGQSRWLNVCGKVVERDSDHRGQRLVGSIRDISQRKGIEEELRVKETQLETIGANVPALLAILDPESQRYRYVNRQYELSLGLARQEILGKTIREIAGEANYENARKYLAVASNGTRTTYEREFQLVEGRTWGRVDYVPQFDEAGRVESILILGVDITDLKNAAEALSRSEERFRLAMDATAEGVWDHDLVRDEVYYSPAYYRMAGYSVGEIGGPRQFEQYVHAEDRARVVSVIDGCIQNMCNEFDIDYRLQAKDGGWHWANSRGMVVDRDVSGKALRMIGTTRDVSDRREREERIAALTNELQTILDTAPVGIGKIVDGSFVWINAAIPRLFNYPIDALVGRDLSTLFPTDEAYRAAAERIRAALSGGEGAFSMVQELVRGDGLPSTIYLSGKAIDTADPGKGFILTGEDISKQRQLEDKLRSSEATYRALFGAVADCLCLVDRESGLILDCNPATLAQFGYTREEFIGTPFTSSSMHPDARTVAEMASGSLIPLHYYRRKDGTGVPMEITSSLLSIEGREVIVAAMRDITRRIESEREIRHLLREKELILREVHHRIKNNLQAVISILSIRIADSGDARANTVLSEAVGEIESMSLLYDKLYRTEYTGAVPIRMYLPELLSQAAQVFGGELDLKFETEIEDISLDAGVLSRLGIVINELVTNSLKYAFDGVEVPTIRLHVARQGDMIHLVYEDNGAGLPESFSLDGTKGFGMQLIQAMAQQFAGSISVESRGGARFSLDFKS